MFLVIVDGLALLLLFLNVVLLAAVHARRVRQYFRTRRAKRFRARVEEVFDEFDPATRARAPGWLRAQIGEFDELERPIAATMLIEGMKAASEEERAPDVLRDAGVLDSLTRSSSRGPAWRRALAIRTLGWIGADESVPALLERLTDRSRHVRESAVRALGQIAEPTALPPLAELFRSPGRVGPGVVYDALVAFGARAEPVFADGLGSHIASVRVASCFGIAAVSEPASARRLLEAPLGDEAAAVRTAAAESLGRMGGERLPEALARATHDEQATVRCAATSALGSFDDPSGVKLAADALLDPDRETAVRAGESLVRLTERPSAADAASQALQRTQGAWPVERALILAPLGAF